MSIMFGALLQELSNFLVRLRIIVVFVQREYSSFNFCTRTPTSNHVAISPAMRYGEGTAVFTLNRTSQDGRGVTLLCPWGTHLSQWINSRVYNDLLSAGGEILVERRNKLRAHELNSEIWCRRTSVRVTPFPSADCYPLRSWETRHLHSS